MRTIKDTPRSIVENRKFHFGIFKTEFSDLNFADIDPLNLGVTPKPLRALRLKEWQHYAITHPDFYFGTVILTAHFTANSFFNIYDRKKGELAEHKRMLTPGHARVAPSLFGGHSKVSERGFKIEYINDLDKGFHEIRVDIAAGHGLPAVSGTARVLEDTAKIQPLIACLPVGRNRAMYTHKVACPVEGGFRVGSDTIKFDPARDTVLIDIHKATYPHHFWWKWANFAGFDSSGKILSANLTDNLILDQRAWNECAMWHGGVISLMNPVKYDFNERDTMKPWEIHDDEGRVALKFVPEGEKKEDLNFGLIRTHYRQPFGKFNGFLVDDAGTKHVVRDIFGVTELMDSWL
ncbi:MAG: DUF2804 domain-containing protein [bacterium]